MGGSSVGGKVRRSRRRRGGHGLVAVAARVRRTDEERKTKKGYIKGGT